MIGEESLALENSQDDMTWNAGDQGFEMTLSAKIPSLIEKNIARFVNTLTTTPLSDCDFPLHPGGKAILEAVEKSLELKKPQTTSSWNVLEKYGNMSSATFLFVLDELLQIGHKHTHSIGLGFGPGLSIEGLLLKNLNLSQ